MTTQSRYIRIALATKLTRANANTETPTPTYPTRPPVRPPAVHNVEAHRRVGRVEPAHPHPDTRARKLARAQKPIR